MTQILLEAIYKDLEVMKELEQQRQDEIDWLDWAGV
jgi:hypothetical protein